MLVATIVLAASGAVRANGAFPDEFSIHFPPNTPHRILMGANFGMLVSEDEGLTWRYSCEPWVVAGSNAALATANVSFYQVTADDTLLATAVNVTRSADDACTWPVSGGSVAGQSVYDFFPDPNDATFVLAIVYTVAGSYIVASHDGGSTFDAPRLYDTTTTSHDLLTGIEIARSKPGVVYATTESTAGGIGKFLASANSGGTWTEYPLDGVPGVTAATQPRILAIDPTDEKKVYLRLLAGITDAMAVTPDGGQSFQVILNIPGQFSSFLRAGDGALYAGTLDGKLYVRPAGAASFGAARNSPHLRCLGQRPGTTRIYACGDMVVDGFSLAYSDDNASTFQPMMSFTQLLGPLTCAPVATNCQAHWDRIQGVLGIGAVPDAGQGGGGGGGGGQTPGKSCASAGPDAPALLIAAGFLFRRRRRKS
jgi:MYXO-CTERM domain-containing protein